MTQWDALCTQLDEAINMPSNYEEVLNEERPLTATVGACGHDIPAAMREKLGRFPLCPSCTIDYRFSDIRKIQADLRRRDGIFASKTNPESSGGLKHRDYTRLWVKNKIQCFQDIQNLENLRRDFPEQAEEWGVLKALEKWEQLQDEVARVPGYKYVQDSSKESKEEEKAMLIPSPGKADVVVGTSTSLTPQEMNDLLEQDREWHVVTPKRKTKKRRVVDLTEPVETWSEELSSTQMSDATLPDDEILQEMDDVTKRLDQRSAMGSFDLFDAFTGAEFSTISESDGYEAPHNNESMTSPTPPSSAPPSPTPASLALSSLTPPSVARLPVVQPGRSALKGTRLTPVTSRTTFADKTTILGSPNSQSTEKRHNKHTIARCARKRCTFHRGKPHYRPGKWSSPEGFEKKDTSFMSMTWPGYEKHMQESPTVSNDRVLVEAEDSTPKPTFESEVTKLMNKARDRKLAENKDAVTTAPGTKMFEMFEIKMKTEQSGAIAHSTVTGFGDGSPVLEKQVTSPAIKVFEINIKTDRKNLAILSTGSKIGEHTQLSKQQVKNTASSTQPLIPQSAMPQGKTKGRKVKKPTASKVTTTERKRIRMREGQNQKTSNVAKVSAGNEQMQLILHPTMRRGREKEGFEASATHTTATIPSDGGVQHQEQPLPNPLQAARDGQEGPAPSKPGLRDLHRSKPKPGLTIGVNETESER